MVNGVPSTPFGAYAMLTKSASEGASPRVHQGCGGAVRKLIMIAFQVSRLTHGEIFVHLLLIKLIPQNEDCFGRQGISQPCQSVGIALKDGLENP